MKDIVSTVTGYLSRLNSGSVTVENQAWDLYINEIKVGEIDHAEYSYYKRRVIADVEVWISQLLNVIAIPWNIFLNVVWYLPAAFLWMAFAIVFLEPSAWSEIIRQYQINPIATIKAAAQTYLYFAAVCIAIYALMGHRFGFRNFFDETTNRRLRLHCKSPVLGDIELRRPINHSVVHV